MSPSYTGSQILKGDSPTWLSYWKLKKFFRLSTKYEMDRGDWSEGLFDAHSHIPCPEEQKQCLVCHDLLKDRQCSYLNWRRNLRFDFGGRIHRNLEPYLNLKIKIAKIMASSQ